MLCISPRKPVSEGDRNKDQEGASAWCAFAATQICLSSWLSLPYPLSEYTQQKLYVVEVTLPLSTSPPTSTPFLPRVEHSSYHISQKPTSWHIPSASGVKFGNFEKSLEKKRPSGQAAIGSTKMASLVLVGRRCF